MSEVPMTKMVSVNPIRVRGVRRTVRRAIDQVLSEGRSTPREPQPMQYLKGVV